MKTALTCKICNNQSHNQSFTAKERMLGLNDNFEYFECANCNCIQIIEIPENICGLTIAIIVSINKIKNESYKNFSRENN
jgi:hypothetical protein